MLFGTIESLFPHFLFVRSKALLGRSSILILLVEYANEELIKNVLVPLISGNKPQFDITDPLDYAKAIVNAVTHYERFSPLGGGQSK